MTAPMADQPATGLASTEPAVSWALVQAFVQAVILLGDVTAFSSWRPEVLGAVHAVFASAVAIAGAVYTRNRTTTDATLGVLSQLVAAPADDVAARVVDYLDHRDERAAIDGPTDGDERGPAFLVQITPDVSRTALAALYELALEAAPPASWNRAAIVAELEKRGVEITARSPAG